MIDEAELGTRDAKGHWTPNKRCSYGPLFARPTRPLAIARWFVRSYLVSWQLLYFAVALAVWLVATPGPETTRRWAVGWVAVILVRNLAIIAAWYGVWHLRLFTRKAQATRAKYNAKWPSTSTRFTFGSQTRENVFWTLASGVPIVTAYEAVGLWLFASGRIPWLQWNDHPIWIVVVMLLIPLWREIHFYVVHRLIHAPALYKTVHALHHRNVNPGPWSGMSMHPIEHVAYLSAMAIHWVVPSHPLHMLFNQFHLVMAPVPGHAGFDVVELGSAALPTNGLNHYLHHKYFEVNYSDGAIPLDRWFGSFHDGSPEAFERLRSRRGVTTGRE